MGLFDNIASISGNLQRPQNRLTTLPTQAPTGLPNLAQLRQSIATARPPALQPTPTQTPQLPTQAQVPNTFSPQRPNVQELMARIQQNANRNPFVAGSFPRFPTQGTQPTFGNPFFQGNFPQGIGTKRL